MNENVISTSSIFSFKSFEMDKKGSAGYNNYQWISTLPLNSYHFTWYPSNRSQIIILTHVFAEMFGIKYCTFEGI